jgi:vacuolar-type H+-ATPase subunit E/Vma4
MLDIVEEIEKKAIAKYKREAEQKAKKAKQEAEQKAKKARQEARREAEQKAKKAKQEALASVAENLLKDGIPRKTIIKSLRVSTEWLTNLEESIRKKDSPHGPRR